VRAPRALPRCAQAAFRRFCANCGYRDGGMKGPRFPWVDRLRPRSYEAPAQAPMAALYGAWAPTST